MELGLGAKVVLITGGSDGLGFSLARSLVGENVKVGILARDVDKLQESTLKLREVGGEVLEVAGDVTDASCLKQFVDLAVERWGRIDGVVNNAGRHAGGNFVDQDDSIWEDDLNLKLMSAVRLIRYSLPHLTPGTGSIVNTLAIAAKAPSGASTPSSVTRAAGMALTKALSKELASSGIRVNAVLIGLIESGQWERRASELNIDLGELYVQMAREAGIPMGRVGKGKDFANLVSFLLSECSSYITGSAINLDGGLCPVV